MRTGGAIRAKNEERENRKYCKKITKNLSLLLRWLKFNYNETQRHVSASWMNWREEKRREEKRRERKRKEKKREKRFIKMVGLCFKCILFQSSNTLQDLMFLFARLLSSSSSPSPSAFHEPTSRVSHVAGWSCSLVVFAGAHNWKISPPSTKLQITFDWSDEESRSDTEWTKWMNVFVEGMSIMHRMDGTGKNNMKWWKICR